MKLGGDPKVVEVLLVEDSPGDVRLTREAFRDAYQLQANAFLTKPVQLEAFESLAKSISDFWLTRVMLPLRLGE